jgi:serine/threonine protein kinase
MADSDNILKNIAKKLGDQYEYLRHLGGGEFSNVYLVRHKISGKEHALKILDYHYLLQRLKKEDLPDADSKSKFNLIKKRFITEAKLYKKIDHPNIVKIHETGVLADTDQEIEIPYFIMDYIEGSTLANVLKSEAPFDLNRVISISQNVLEALEAIHHKNIIHRDLKPSNIMIREETGEAIIIDFGIAKDIVSGTRLTTTGTLLGSPMYMAPEQFTDSSKVGPGIDIYSFGAVLFEMLTGEPPFRGSNFIELMNAHRERPIPDVREKNPRLPERMSRILPKAMAKNPGERYRSSRDLLIALKGETIPEIEAAVEVGKTSRKFTRYFIYLAGAITIAVALILILNPFDRDKEKEEKPIRIVSGTSGMEEKPLKTVDPTSERDITGEQEQIQEMQEEFRKLNEFLNRYADNKEKIPRKQNECQAFLDKYSHLSEESSNKTVIEMIAKAKKSKENMEQLKKELERDTQFLKHIEDAKKYAENHQFKDADDALKKAVKIEKDADEDVIKEIHQLIAAKKDEYERLHGEAAYQDIKGSINLARYLDFTKKFPNSKYLTDLQDQLKKADKRLPPEKYWNDSIKKSKKGYYEFSFPEERNNHIMIYIPERRIWIDKYEVSWGLFRRFCAAENIALSSGTGSEYFCKTDECPAVVTYNDVERYCRRYGFRLPRLDEWEYVAGKGVNIYPWGNDLPGEKGTWQANFDSLGDDGREKDGFNGTAPVRRFEAFSSPFGVVNMAGNVWEWVQGRILKGGGFLSGKEDLLIKRSLPGSDADTHGFRCVQDEQ